MTEDDIQFVRELYATANRQVEPPIESVQMFSVVIVRRLLALLIESEAMREKAEFWNLHSLDPEDCEWCIETSCDGSGHFYDDSDWIAAKKKEWGIL